VEIYTLRNGHGIEARIMTYGASIVSLKTPDRNGHLQNVVLGFDTLDPYVAGVPYYGATVGRYANRIAQSRFALDGRTYPLIANDGSNSLNPAHSSLEHKLTINADKFTPVNATLIPTGELRPVASTPFDFRNEAVIGSRIDADDAQLNVGHGYDHNWALNAAPGKGLRFAARLIDPASGRVLEVRTTQPGLQFYSGNFMNGKPPGQGSVYNFRTGLCLETQHFPDSPNHPTFPNTILRPGEIYEQKTELHFRTLKAPAT
jgi:galactose mutarotase-like enzyme